MLSKIKNKWTPLSLFRNSARNIPAYKKFLKARKFNPAGVNLARDFDRVPVMTKQNYFYQYKYFDFFKENRIAPLIYASSGSSGKETFWFRGDLQEEQGGVIHEQIFRDIFKIKKEEPTLVLVCFSMGIWVAGSFTAASCRQLPRRGWQISTVTPGIDKEDIFNVLKEVAPPFKNVIFAGYPPFISDILVEAHQRKIKLPKNPFVITAGDTASESWRNVIMDLLGTKVPTRIINIYGSADVGVMAFETPLAIFIRRAALQNKKFLSQLPSAKNGLAAIFQFSQSHIYFEKVDSELVLTANTAIPLIRYNIHDQGDVLYPKDIVAKLKEHDLYRKALKQGLKKWLAMPLVMRTGRTDVAVTFYALNIYPENLKAALDDPRIQKYLSGNYLAFNKDVSNGKKQKLFVHFELASGKIHSTQLEKLAADIVLEKLVELSHEFRKLHNSIGSQAWPVVKLIPFGHKDFSKKEGHALLSIKGKKPRLIA